jgi:hypothetical protein
VAQHEYGAEIALGAVVVAELTVNKELKLNTLKIVQAKGVERLKQAAEESVGEGAEAVLTGEVVESKVPK